MKKIKLKYKNGYIDKNKIIQNVIYILHFARECDMIYPEHEKTC